MLLLLLWFHEGVHDDEELVHETVPLAAALIQPDQPFALRISGAQCGAKLYETEKVSLGPETEPRPEHHNQP